MSIYEEIGRNIRQRREDAGLTQEELGQRIGLTRTSVTNFESGSQRIQIDALYTIAEALNVPASVLLPYGKTGKKLQVEEKLLKGLSQPVRAWVKEALVLREGRRVLPQVYEPGEKLTVDEILRDFELKDAPVPIEEIAGFLGIEVLYASAKQELAGCLYQEDELSVIAVNSALSRTRQRFTIAHLLAWRLQNPKDGFHLDLGFSGSNEREAEANRVALDFLLPDFLIQRDLKGKVLDFEDDGEIRGLAEKYKVSTQVMNFRLLPILPVKIAR
jgi:Zn-dependent peptidase ImmA (M78 family)/transcriptional regulator with XRE-family HTH domain